MAHDAASIAWFYYELMIFSNEKCKITRRSKSVYSGLATSMRIGR